METETGVLETGTSPLLELVHANFNPLLYSKSWEPPENLTLSKWAERYYHLSSEYSNRTGPIQLFGWQREIFDAFTDPNVHELVVMCGTQLVKTILLQVICAYIIAEAPGPILITQPKEGDAKDFSKERLAPMLRDCPILQGRVSNNRFDGNTILFKEFPGGSISLVGALVAGNLARRSIRYLLADEIDKYAASAGVEGDPLKLGRERLVTYGSGAKLVTCCSPTLEINEFGGSRIARAYGDTDQRKPLVSCPECGFLQILVWDQVKWNLKGKQPDSWYECVGCKAKWNDKVRIDAANEAKWEPQAPFIGKAGFWISHLYSPWKKLNKMVSDYLAAKGNPAEEQVFVNTALAETYKDTAARPDWEVLRGLAEDYKFNDEAIVPMPATYLTCAVDVQQDWFALEVKAWGKGRESWSIGHYRLQQLDHENRPVPTSDPSSFRMLDDFLTRTWPHACGIRIPIVAMAVDTGHNPTRVYEFAQRHVQAAYTAKGVFVLRPQTVVPIRGATHEDFKVIAGISDDDAARKRGGVRIVSIGTSPVKLEFYGDVNLRRSKEGYPVGYCHFPRYEDWVFQGLCSEAKVVSENGKITWKKEVARNEPLDLHVYNRAMAQIIGITGKSDQWWAGFDSQLGIDRNLRLPETADETHPSYEQFQADVREKSIQKPKARQELRPVVGTFRY